jgi:gliding motility-associated-like protein
LDQSGVITVNAENAAGCAGTATITVNMQTEVTDLGPDLNLCEGDDAEIVTGWSNDHTFAWDHGPTSSSVVVSDAGTYHVVVTSPDGCVSEDEINVLVNPYPVVDLGPDQVACEGDVVNLVAGELGPNYEWNTGSHATNININQTGDYSVSVDNGFCESTDMVHVLFNPLPDNPFTPSEMDFCFTLPPYVAKLDAKNEGCTYEWEDGTTGQVYNATAPGIYYVRISTDLGCEARYQMFIFEECPGAIWAPNAFTPDGDGINDVWLVEGVNVASYYLVMWNRWGEQMFETHSLDRPWLGQRRDGDEYVEAGVYHYRIIFTIDEGGGKISEEKEINGQVTLVR